MSTRNFTIPLTFAWKPFAGIRTDWDRIHNTMFTIEVYVDEDDTWTWGLETRDDIDNGYGFLTREAAQEAVEAKLTELFVKAVL